MSTIYDFSANTLTGKTIDFKDYKGKVLLIVNTASKCGFTSQYEEFEALHKKYKEQGLVIIGFPCNQFGKQESGSNEDIADFCKINYGVSFTIMSKINVNGDDSHDIYQWLKKQKGGMLTNAIKWNFTKFLIGRDGLVIDRFAPTTKPEKLTDKITEALNTKESSK